MFSPTTIASSTTIPIASMKACVDMMLIDTPSSTITTSVPMKDMTIPAATPEGEALFEEERQRDEDQY